MNLFHMLFATKKFSRLPQAFRFLRGMAALALLCGAAALAGCGGGGGGGSAAVQLVPDAPDTQPAPVVLDTDLPANYTAMPLSIGNRRDTAPASYENEAQWNMERIGADLLHWTYCGEGGDESCGDSDYVRGAGVTIAIVDDGVDLDHVDLVDNIVTIDGFQFHAAGSGEWHGTHVAGIAAAALNGGGVVGVAPDAKILPLKYLGSDSTDLNTIYDAAAANHAFVANNSWGWIDEYVKVSVAAGEWMVSETTSSTNLANPTALAAGFYWIGLPRTFSSNPSVVNTTLQLNKINTDNVHTALENAVRQDGMLLVFAHGNSGWNSQNGAVSLCPDDNSIVYDSSTGSYSCSDTDYVRLNVSDVAIDTIYGQEYQNTRVTAANPASIDEIGEDYADVLATKPLFENDALHGHNGAWLNVVATNQDDDMAFFSNGCGDSKYACLAAPGQGILSDYSNDQYATASGTSQAAPHVTGAAALLKGTFPNLVASEVATILLDSAEGMGTCANETSRTTLCVDIAYGHGMLDISAAFTPTSFIALSGGGGNSNNSASFALENSRMELSAPFGAAPWRQQSFMVGGLDNYGRVFYTLMDLANGAWVIKPVPAEDEISGGGVHAAFAAPVALAGAAGPNTAGAANALAATHWRQQDAAGAYGIQSMGAAQSRFMLANINDATALGWRYRTGYEKWQPQATEEFWQASYDAGEAHQALLEMSGGGALAHWGNLAPKLGFLASAADGKRQTAARLAWDGAAWRLRAEGGVLSEEGTILGNTWSGAFAVQQTRTAYGRVSGGYNIREGMLFADFWLGDSTADGVSGGVLQGARAISNAWSAGWRQGNWTLTAGQEMSIRRGGMDWSYVSGYQANGDYATTNRRIDLAAGKRPGYAALQYANTTPANGWRAAWTLEYLHNAPTRNYQDHALATSIALHYRF